MKPILALLALWLLTAAALPVANGPVRVCAGPERRSCSPVELIDLRLTAPETHIERIITVRSGALPLSRPLMVWITAMASAEVRWNGVLIGSNGRPGPDQASERPGRFIAHIPVPTELVRPGDNVVSLRLSAHHLWLPVQRTVHAFGVTPYETPTLPGLTAYLPALLTMGALLAALIYFAASAWSDRRDRRAAPIALIAGLAMLQLVIEVARAFIAYPYPWHLARVAAIAVLAGATALLAAVYAAGRFAPAWRGRVVGLTATAVVASLVLVPWYDLKAMAPILAAAAALIVCGGRGLRDRRPGATVCLLGGVMIIILMGWQLTAFLDQAYYLIVAALLVALVAEQVSVLRRSRQDREQEAKRAVALEERLRRATEAGEPIVQLKDGGRVHRVPEGDILYLKAADDYCEVALVDGRVLLVTATLARTVESLSEGFVRVHKSYAVSRGHLAASEPRPGGGRQLRLDDGTAIPVGRSYGAAVAGTLRPSPAGG